ncbi:hypothetical protein MASR2M79_22890 [Aminivibrio sp.]
MDGTPLRGRRAKRTFIGAAAGILLAAALLFPPSALAGVKVEGVPPWLRERMERSAETVWSEIASGEEAGGQKALSLLSMVSERVFTGFSVVEAVRDGQDVLLRLEPGEKIPWVVEIASPQLSPPVSSWFQEDVSGLEKKIAELLPLLPLDALTWADLSLRDAIASIAAAQVPGWTPGLLVKLQDGRRILQISFAPRPPLVLAIVPKVYSSSLPVMLRSDLRENMLRTLAPVVGLPIEWAGANSKRIEALAEGKLLDSNTVGNTRATVEVHFQPGQIAPANAEVESPRYSIRAWVAAYAGSDTKFPEIGLHLGRKFVPFSGLTMELYGEWLLSANDFSLESRWGVRWSPWKHIMAGVEQAYPGSVTWYRLWFEGGVNAPYAWWRISEDGDHSAGIGYRINGRISLELHYDGRDDEKISLKAISDL